MDDVESGRMRTPANAYFIYIKPTFEMILESSVLYNRGVAIRPNALLTSAQACQSLLSVN